MLPHYTQRTPEWRDKYVEEYKKNLRTSIENEIIQFKSLLVTQPLKKDEWNLQIKKREQLLGIEENPTKVSEKLKKRKKPISAALKRLVWNNNVGEEIGKTKCTCCKVTDITQISFHCGHIIAESNGGETILTNLKPICQNCNSSMGTKNMNEFMKSFV